MKTLLTLILLLSLNSVQAQQVYEWWSKFNFTQSLTDKVAFSLDLQHRRQNGSNTDYNLLRYTMTNSARLWLFYSANNNWSIILSPIALFENRNFNHSTQKLQHSSELRTMTGLAKAVAIDKATVNNRLLYELSFIQTAPSNNITRHRYRLQNSLLIPLKNRNNGSALNYNLANEVFIKTIQRKSSFDQNRIYQAIQWKDNFTAINVGYQLTIQQELSSLVHKNQFVISVNTHL